MRLSHCNRCGYEIKKAPLGITGNLVGIEPNFCRRCGNALLVEGVDHQVPWNESDDDEEFSLYNFDDFDEIVKGIIPENYKNLLPEQLERYAVSGNMEANGNRPIPKHRYQPTGRGARAADASRDGKLCPARSFTACAAQYDGQDLGALVRQYHLVWLNGLVGRTHLSSTPKEVDELRTILAKSYYIVVPCDCDRVTYIPDQSNPDFMRKA